MDLPDKTFTISDESIVQVRVRQTRCCFCCNLILEIALLFFAIFMVSVLASFGTIDPDPAYYICLIAFSYIGYVILFYRFWRQWTYKSELT